MRKRKLGTDIFKYIVSSCQFTFLEVKDQCKRMRTGLVGFSESVASSPFV